MRSAALLRGVGLMFAMFLATASAQQPSHPQFYVPAPAQYYQPLYRPTPPPPVWVPGRGGGYSLFYNGYYYPAQYRCGGGFCCYFMGRFVLAPAAPYYRPAPSQQSPSTPNNGLTPRDVIDIIGVIKALGELGGIFGF